MFEILNAGIHTAAYIPPPPDLSNVVLNIKELAFITGEQAYDHYGNQFQFNYDGTKLLTPAYGRASTKLRNINHATNTITTYLELPITGGAAASDRFDVIYNFRPVGATTDGYPEVTRRVLQMDGSYLVGNSAPVGITNIDNYQCSSTGNLVYGNKGVFRVTPAGGYEKVIDAGADTLLGAVFSEDERTIVTVGRSTFFLARYEIQPDKTYALVKRQTFGYSNMFPYNANENGMEAGLDIDLNHIVIPTTIGGTVFKYNATLREYAVLQDLGYPVGSQMYPTVSMDRSGTLVAVARWQSGVNLYKRASNGTYALAHSFPRDGNGTHKLKLSPDGSMLGYDSVWYDSNKGAIRIYKLYDR